MPRTQPSIYYCITGDRAIFLDLRCNRYFALPSGPNAKFIGCIGDRNSGSLNRADFDQITNGKMQSDLGHVSQTAPVTPRIIAAESDLYAQISRSQASSALVVIACLTFFAAKILVWVFPLHIVIGALGEGAGSVEPQSALARMDRIAAAFRKAQFFAPAQGNCLPLTIAFVWLCRRFGHHPALVIGVRVNPFSAHCWSQAGAVVLNDAFERVLPYQPILTR